MKNFKTLIAALFVAIAAGFAACGGNEPTPGTGPGKPGPGGPNPQPTGDTLTVAQALTKQDNSKAYVKGYIVGWYSSHVNDKKVIFSAAATADTSVIATNIVIAESADETDQAKCVCVQLPAGNVRSALNLKDHADNLKKAVKLYGTLTKYNTLPGLKEVTFAVLDGKEYGQNPAAGPIVTDNDGTQAKPFTVDEVITLNNTKTGNFYVKGIIVGQVKAGATSAAGFCEFAAPFTANADGENTNILIASEAGVTDLAQLVPVQLPAGFLRVALNLIAHPENVGKEVVLVGSLEKYFGQAGVKSITEAYLDGKKIEREIGEAPTATPISVADFCKLADNTGTPGVWYELTGTIGGTINTTYGNFDLTDATGTVAVYGLTASYLPLLSATKADNDKSFASLGLKEGDNVTIRGVKITYSGKAEVVGGYLVKKN